MKQRKNGEYACRKGQRCNILAFVKSNYSKMSSQTELSLYYENKLQTYLNNEQFDNPKSDTDVQVVRINSIQRIICWSLYFLKDSDLLIFFKGRYR